MKTFALFCLCAAALLGGCDSMSSRVEQRFATVAPHTRNYAANRRAVYEAALVAVKNVGLLAGRTSSARGHIEAYAPIRTGDSVSDTRQTALDITVTEVGEGQTEVALLVSEETEGHFPGGVSQQALREHSLYELYYTTLQQVLLENGSLKADAKP